MISQNPADQRTHGGLRKKRQSKKSHSNHWGTHPLVAHLVGCLLIVLILGLGFALLLEPMTAQHESLTNEKARIEQLVAAMPKLSQTQILLETQFVQDVRRVRDKIQRIPNNEPFDRFVIDLSSLAARSGISIASVQPVGTHSGATAELQVIEVQLDGNFTGLCRFLDECQRYSLPVWVTSLETQMQTVDARRQREELGTIKLMIRLPFQFHDDMSRRIQTYADSIELQSQEA